MPRLPARSTRPIGQRTRGKTARNRLRRIDNYLRMNEHALLTRQDGPFAGAYFVDLGFGAEPFTTLESAARLRRANPALPILGVEIAPEHVARALPFADDRTRFRVGGFNIPLEAGEHVRLIRAFNVLRQYEEADVLPAWQTMGLALLEGGLLVEGTSDPSGRMWTANLLRRRGEALVYEGLLFGTNFRGGIAPGMFQPVLPKNCIHRMLPGEPVYAFMTAWNEAVRHTAPYRTWGARQWFEAAAVHCAGQGFSIDLRRKLLRRGYLLWQGGPGPAQVPLPAGH
ncbi:MAG: hypothetical protein Kow0077_27700 [Anaerolineae bacterium]